MRPQALGRSLRACQARFEAHVGCLWSDLKVAQLAKGDEVAGTVLAAAAEDQVVEDFDLEQMPGADPVAVDAAVGLGGLGIAAGAVVGAVDGVGPRGDRWGKGPAGVVAGRGL